MVVFALLMMITIVAASVWITRRMVGGDPGSAQAATAFVPLDDAPPGVLDAIVRQLRQHPDVA